METKIDEMEGFEVDSVLADTGYDWSTSPEGPDLWQAVVMVPHGPRCELTAVMVGGGVEVRCPIASWEAPASETSQAAVARFLTAAQARLPFTHFLLEAEVATVVSFAAADRLDVELADGVAAVIAACRLASREIRALANESVARVYLQVTDES